MRIFRTLRRTLMKEKSTYRYLLYAIGEIILVVLGILIALQINNMNEDSKNEKIANIYLTDLKKDFSLDLLKLDNYIDQNNSRIRDIDSIISMFFTVEIFSKKEMLNFANLHGRLVSESFYVPEKSTIRQIEASSHGRLIENKDLRDRIFRYYSICEANEKNNEVSVQLYQHNFITKDISKAVFYGAETFEILYGDALNRAYTNFKELPLNTDYVNAMNQKKNMSIDQNSRYLDMRDNAQEIIALIEKEFDN